MLLSFDVQLWKLLLFSFKVASDALKGQQKNKQIFSGDENKSNHDHKDRLCQYSNVPWLSDKIVRADKVVYLPPSSHGNSWRTSSDIVTGSLMLCTELSSCLSSPINRYKLSNLSDGWSWLSCCKKRCLCVWQRKMRKESCRPQEKSNFPALLFWR